MKKVTKKPITLEEGIRLIPHDHFYCNDSGKCPFWQTRLYTKGQLKRFIKEGKLTPFLPNDCFHNAKGKCRVEYCAFLKGNLSIQDGCKDCGINCDKSKEQEESDIKYLEEIIAEGVTEHITQEDIEEYKKELAALKDGTSEDCAFRLRIENREYADAYKEMFPDEVDLIDKIVEEDKLKYWYKESGKE